jgi:nicotinic acid mononucleotide adenylyltransferase
MPERRPRHKQHVEHYAHRIAMLRAAVKPYAKLRVLETDDVSFTIKRTLPRLQQRFKGSQLIFLAGSDVVAHMHTWPSIELLTQTCELAIGIREGSSHVGVSKLPYMTRARLPFYIVESCAPSVSSHKVREALRKRHYVQGLLASVARYSNRNWLYVSLAQPQ